MKDKHKDWLTPKAGTADADLEITKKSLLKIATGATMMYVPKEMQEHGDPRFTKIIQQISDLIDAEFPELTEDQRVMGISITISMSWAAAIIVKIQETGAAMKKEGLL